MNQFLNNLAEFPTIIEWTKQQDTSALSRFLKADLERPLICVGSGGSLSICELIAIMYEALGGIAKAITPYSVYSMSDKALSRCKILLVSHSGRNKDIVRIAIHCKELTPQWVANLTTGDGPRNDLKGIVPMSHSFNFTSSIKDGFISVNSVIANYALLLKALGGKFDVNVSLPGFDIDFSAISHFMILYGGWGKAAAVDLESKLVESGIATCAVSDYRNFCHGRFIFAGNHCGHEKIADVPDDGAVIMLATPREMNLAEKIKSLLPGRCKVITLHSTHSDSMAALDLLLKVTALAGCIAESHKVNPLNPPNRGGIDKLKPQQIPFISDIKKAGPLL